MSDNTSNPGGTQAGSRRFCVTMMFHPSHHVTDLSKTESWFEEVFGCQSTNIATSMRQASPGEGLPPPQEGYPTGYSTFTPIRDVLFDSIDPTRLVLHGVQRYPTVEKPHLKTIGWYVDGMAEAYRDLKQRGIRVTNQLGEIATGDEPPTAEGRPIPLYFTMPEDAGLRYEFFPAIPFPLDPRVVPGWSLPPVSDDDPLGIERCSHHTVLTGHPERAVKLAVDALGGEIIHTGGNQLLGANSTFVHLADTILEYAIPDSGTPAHEDWEKDNPDDTYHSITWKVADLDRAEAHLESHGVRIRTRSEDTLITDPDTSLGIPWGFTSRVVPGDPRPRS
jgi:catechol 2,3-dioxygenase-like lactoylglutathione lyase family enzyme